MKTACFLFLFTLVALTACQQKTPTTQVITVTKHILVVPQMYSGIIKPLSTLNIVATADGTIQALPIHLGQSVAQNALLVVLNSPKYAKDYQQALLTYLKTKSDYQAQNKKFAGTKELWKNGLIARNDYDSQQSDLANAYAQLLQQQHELTKYLSPNSTLEQQLNLNDHQQLEAIFKQQSSLLNITTPVSGVILAPLKSSANDANPDNLPTLGTSVKAGDSLLTLGDLSGYLIPISVSQMDIGTIKVGQKAHVSSDAFPEQLSGFVSQVGLQAENDSNSGFTGMPSFPVEIRITHLPSTAHDHVRLGMSAQVAIETAATQPTLSIPISAVGQINHQPVVRRIKNHRLETVTITTGITTIDQIQVLTGLIEGDAILATYPT